MAAAFPRSWTYASAVCSMRRRALGVRPSSGVSHRVAIRSATSVFSKSRSLVSTSSARTRPAASIAPPQRRAGLRGPRTTRRRASRARRSGPGRRARRSRRRRRPARSAHAAPARRGRGRSRSPGRPARRRARRPEAARRNDRAGPRCTRALRRCVAAATPRLCGGSQIGLIRRRLADERRHQFVAQAAALALEARAGFGIALDRIGRERLDVGEDRLGEQAEDVGLDARACGGGGQSPPGDPRAHAIGGLKGVECATLAQLAAAEGHVHLAPRATRPGRAPDQFDELPQRLGHAGPDAASERSLERAGVSRHLPGDRREDLVGGRLELGLDHVRDLGGQRAPWLPAGVLITQMSNTCVEVHAPSAYYIRRRQETA